MVYHFRSHPLVFVAYALRQCAHTLVSEREGYGLCVRLRPAENNGALILAFLQLLVDCGMFTVAFAILLQLRHSKQLPDELFGRVAAMEKTIIGIDSLLFW